MRLLCLFCILFAACSSGQSGVLGVIRAGSPVIVFSGESNAGGYANNAQAPSAELGDRSSVRILNNQTLASFDVLHISTIGDGVDNTHVGHAGAEAWGAVHGWELEVANRVAAGTFGGNPAYIVKTAQGASKIGEWNGGTYSYNGTGTTIDPWAAFMARLDAVQSVMGAQQFYLFYSQGINDALAGTSVATWKAATKAHFQKIRDRYGRMPIFMMRFDCITAVDMSAYNTAIDEIGAEMSEVYVISSSGATLKDSYHTDYAGTKLIAGRMMDAMLNSLQ